MKNNRTFLEKLLDGAEVEWKTVKSLCNDNFWLMPATPEFDDNGNIPYITSKNIKGGKIDFQNTKYINEYVYQELSRTRCIIENDILISMIGTIGEAVIVKKEDLYFYGQNMYVLRLNNELVNHKFFLYYFTAPFILNSLLSKKNSSNQGYLKAGQIESLKIPIPPLSVQTEIVKILDALTALTSELTSELILRQKQYEYYREKLLSEEELGKVGFEWKTIDEISKKISSGGTPTTSNNGYYDNGTIPWLRTQEVDFKEIWDTNIKITEDALNNSSAKWIPANCVIVAMYGATVGKTAINKIPLTTNQACANIEINDKLACYRYIFHYLTSKYEYIKSLGSGSQTNINAQIIKKLKVPVPPIEEQYRIVSILDKFETLTNSITEGLPLAIEQSQKRYEYYRELLLNFPSRE
ncbi:TPA: restriction endonuclease subunit S [Haemophilus influenzae]|uniref:restriction endonuclease subunit S n=1 Tax=Haemophilus influenzae TaxID=727 RepID=UPI000DD44096|nr:restriction endonuclease subunit S [Haemophilus influenzae]MCK9033575.1 restriction endonuclease subunit S [Haemophilus influenzae]